MMYTVCVWWCAKEGERAKSSMDCNSQAAKQNNILEVYSPSLCLLLSPPSLTITNKHILWVTAGANCQFSLFIPLSLKSRNIKHHQIWLPGKNLSTRLLRLPPFPFLLSPPSFFYFPLPFPSLPSLSLSFSPSLSSSTAGVWEAVFPLSLAHEGPH